MSNRDYVMARLAAARSVTADCDSQLSEAIDHFVEPSEDEDGALRHELITGAEASIRDLALILEQARAACEALTSDDLGAGDLGADEDEDEDEDED